MKTGRYVGLIGVALAVCLVGCGKDEPAADPAQAAPGAGAGAQGQPAGPSPDAIVFERTLVYAQGRIAQNDFQGAREAIAPLENQNLTPAQKSALDAVKRKIPQ